MKERQKLVEEKGELPPLLIFPEGTCSNNTHLMKFRRGAFASLRQVIPCTLKYKVGMVHPAIESLTEAVTTIFLACSFSIIRAEVVVYPVFQPNDYLFEEHKEMGEEKWEIYAWACRDLLSKVGGFGKHDISFKAKY